jgi:GrpB-like predicted nucleotidyltransferase (UPF0157 family)
MLPRLIEIVDYQARWPEEFAAIGARLRAAFGAAALTIHHIGSTSVPGLAAKDVIDLQVSVAALDPAEPLRAMIAMAGYGLRPDIAEDHVPASADPDPALWRKRYAREPDGARRTHVHIRASGLPNQRYPLLFRDYLRANISAASNYAQIKRELAARHADDVDAYYAVKDPVCDLIFDAAELWAARTGWRLPPSDA